MNNIAPLRSALITNPHGFFDRNGGVSEGIYAGLNGGPGSQDNPFHVAQNRARVAEHLGADELASLYQVHGGDVVLVDEPWGEDRPRADAMVTTVKGIALTILTADCCPILFEDPQAGIIGAAHAGWRGAVAGVSDSVLDLMTDLGGKRSEIRAVIGPTINQASYEVGRDMRDAAHNADPATEPFFAGGKDPAHYQFDLPAYVESRLRRGGIQHIDRQDTDTYASEEHFSYRRATHRNEPDYGRQMSAICLR